MVVVEGEKSTPERVVSGVPQGSVLGPLLFLILMLDISESVRKSCIGSFADDTKVWKAIATILCSAEMQDDLREVYGWAGDNNMFFNDKKFLMIVFGEMMSFEREYKTPSGDTITQKNSLRDLGIIIQSDLTFKEHIAALVAKGHRMAAWVIRTFRSRWTVLMLTLLKSVVRCHLEYACIIWSPVDQYSINLIESVQQRFTSKFSCFQTYDDVAQMPLCSVDYPTRLKQLGIYSLERRRERYMILYIYKIIIGLVHNPGFEVQFQERFNSYYIPPIRQPHAPRWVCRARESSFFFVGPRLYNSLPTHLRLLEDEPHPSQKQVNAFKKRLDKYLTDIPDVPGTRANSLLMR